MVIELLTASFRVNWLNFVVPSFSRLPLMIRSVEILLTGTIESLKALNRLLMKEDLPEPVGPNMITLRLSV